MPQIITAKVPVGISACAFGCPVRYNGRALDVTKVMGREKGDFSWTPVCPECLAGLGVLREPVHLTGPGSDVIAGRAKVVSRRGHDVTEQVMAGARSALDALERAGCRGFVAKEASPSCGVAKARTGPRRTATLGAGVFGAMLLESGVFVIPDEGLANPLSWWDWRRRFFAWLYLSDLEISRASDLYDAWHNLKFVLQETDRPRADAIGRRLAALPKGASAEQLEDVRAEILGALGTATTKPRVRAALFKTFAHERKKGRLAGVDLHGLEPGTPEERATVDEVARQLIAAERVAFENDLGFGTSPVIRRDARRIHNRTAQPETRSA